MMKKIFWILFCANVIFFAVMQRGLWWGEQEIQAQPDLHGELIHLLPQSAPAKIASVFASVPASMAVSAPAAIMPAPLVAAPSTPLTPAASTSQRLWTNMAASAAEKSGRPVCLEWGDFSGPDLARITEALSALQLADKLSQRQVERVIGYWVYIPPLKNRAAINRKITELKMLGVNEYFVVQNSGHWQNAISLGAFKSREAAQNFFHDIQEKGVRTARLGERSSKVKATVFTLDSVDADTEAVLMAIQKDFAGSELKNVPCTISGTH